MNAIIESILDTDLYKLTQQQCVLHQYPSATARYTFKCRNKGVKLGFLAESVRKQVQTMSEIKLTTNERMYLETIRFLRPDYLDYLGAYRFNPEQVTIYTGIGEDLIVEIYGTWLESILWEVPLLAIINELYFSYTTDFRTIEGSGIRNLQDKIDIIKQYPHFTFSDFGTRRRYSKKWQAYVVKTLCACCPQLVGTSNVKLAQDNGIKAIGTQAHEFISGHIALVDNIREAQKRAFYVWLQEYGADLGIALTDTFTTKAFYQDFGVVLANAFSGVRQDSGDVFQFGREMIEHYKSLGIDPRTKTIVFSDGLDIPKAISIYKEFTGLVGTSFGIGTNLTNNLGAEPLNIVIKLFECNDKPVVKLSDNSGKSIGDEFVIDRIKKVYGV